MTAFHRPALFCALAGFLVAHASAQATAAPHHTVAAEKTLAGKRRGEPTRALFRYQRDDSASDHLTRVHINTAHTAATPIQPFVFGNFLEHLGGAIYEGVWSQALLNPNLERITDGDKAPPHWEMTGAATWKEDGYLSPRCVRLQAGGSGTGKTPGTPGSISQTIFLPVQRTGRYTGYLYLRAPDVPGTILVTLTGGTGQAVRLFAQTTLAAEKSVWRKLAFPVVFGAEAPVIGQAIRFTVTHAGGGPVDVDQIEIYPDDNILGMDPDVIRRARALQVPVLRYPGGNFASGYHWQDALGMRERRPTRRNPAWGGVEPNSFGINEFIRFCRLIRAKPQLTVNAGDGTPEEAAGWVHYCNSPPRNRYGLMRASNASPEPYDVDLWEVGNELYGGWEIGHTDAAGNAARYLQFRDAMRQADSGLTLIATGKGDEFTPDGLQRDAAWNERLLRAAQANGPAPDYLSLHPLVPLPSNLAGVSYADQYQSVMAFPTFLGERLLPDVARSIASVEGAGAHTRLAVTEWGLIVGGAKWRESPNAETLSGAIFNALTLNALLRNSDWVTLANVTGLLHGGGIKKRQGVVTVDPQYWTQLLYTIEHPHTPVETTTTGPGSDVPARGFLPAVANVPDVDVFAALSDDPKKLVVFAINRHPTEARPLQLDVDGFDATTIPAFVLTAPDLQAGNSLTNPDAVAPQPFPTPPNSLRPSTHGHFVLPPHSLVVFTLYRR